MTHVITAACIDTRDKSCVEVCPVDCIHESERMLVIDPEECIDCAACVPVCPVEAIYADSDLPSDLERFTDVNAAWLEGRVHVDALVSTYLAKPSAPPGAR